MRMPLEANPGVQKLVEVNPMVDAQTVAGLGEYKRGVALRELLGPGRVFYLDPPKWDGEPTVEALFCAENLYALAMATLGCAMSLKAGKAERLSRIAWASETEQRWLEHFKTVARYTGKTPR